MSDLSLTALLRKAIAGDKAAEHEAIRLVYPELKKIAARMTAHEKAGESLSPTVLVHDFYVQKLCAPAGIAVQIKDRNHFFALAARAMRQVLIDRARARNSAKRSPVEGNVFARPCTELPPDTLLAVDTALNRLEKLDPRATRVVELRYYLGCSINETAAILGITIQNAREDWGFARQWLQAQFK